MFAVPYIIGCLGAFMAGWGWRAWRGWRREDFAYSEGWDDGRKDLAALPAEPPAPPIRHGTNSAYTNRRCRCDDCREAHRAAWHKWAAGKRAADPGWQRRPAQPVAMQLSLF